MRIRKRQLPLPFSSLSDPLLPPVQLRRSPASEDKDESPDDSSQWEERKKNGKWKHCLDVFLLYFSLAFAFSLSLSLSIVRPWPACSSLVHCSFSLFLSTFIRFKVRPIFNSFLLLLLLKNNIVALLLSFLWLCGLLYLWVLQCIWFGFREASVFGAETSNGVLPQSTSLHQVVGRWGEREKTFPLKKRRGSFERPSDDQNNTKSNEDQAAAATTTVKPPDQKKTMKTKMNKKCTLPQKQEQSEDHESKPSLGLAGKKKSRGGMLMEGSRCSRVNGRGWRCCQQTLVGYSLCEHHLGKGRLRSMNSVRSRSLAAAATALKSGIVIDQDDKKKSSPSPSSSPSPPPSLPSSTVASKKKMKLGVVKARSISSLLGQTDSLIAAPAPAPPTLPDDNIGE